MLALRPRFPHHVPPIIHPLPLPTHHHFRARLHSRTSPALDRPTLRRCHSSNHNRRHPGRKDKLTITIGNLGAVLGTQLYRPNTSPRWHLGHGFALGYLVANLLVTGTLWWSLRRENGIKLQRQEAGEVPTEELVRSDEDVRWLLQT